MMGQWQDVRSASGKLLCRIDAERRLLEIARGDQQALVDLDVFLAQAREMRSGGIFFGAVSVWGEEGGGEGERGREGDGE